MMPQNLPLVSSMISGSIQTPSAFSSASTRFRFFTRKLNMKGFLLGLKYSVLSSNALHTVKPLPAALLVSRQWNAQPPHTGSSGRPRCFRYQERSFFVFLALKKIPPIPVTRCLVFFMGVQG